MEYKEEYKELINNLIDMIALFTDFPVYAGANPTKESIAVSGFGAPIVTAKDLDNVGVLNMTINGKSADYEKMLDALSTIHRRLTVRNNYPQGDTWQIFAITTTASPREIAVEQADTTKFIFGSSIAVKYYILGMKGE